MARGSRRGALRAAAMEALKAGEAAGDEDLARRPPVGERIEPAADGDWVVRQVAGTASPRLYRCPGCDQELRPATPHVVSWPVGRPDDRRHWHTACWSARDRRMVKVHRSKNAPRHG